MGWLAVLLVLQTTIIMCSAELVITRPPRNATVLNNKRYQLHCTASGPSKFRIKWFHNDEEMPRTGMNYRILGSGTIRFRQVQVSDRGTYCCKVESRKEALYSDPVYLVVETEVSITDYSPTKELYLPNKTSVKLMCRAAGIPGPTIQWRKNGISIIDESEAKVQIMETRKKEGVILESFLKTENLTKTTKFECEAVNRHSGGPSVRSKFFTIHIIPDHDVNKRTPGICVPYNGTQCADVIGSGSVFLNLSQANHFDDQERMAKELLTAVHGVTTTPNLQERCDLHAEKFVCNYFFPPCRSNLDPIPVPLCRESCIAMQDLLCYVQWPIIQRSNTTVKFPVCDSKLPSKWDDKTDCTEAGLFDRDIEEIKDHCYMDRGRWYNGTVNVTKSGKPCQRWSAKEPKNHKDHCYMDRGRWYNGTVNVTKSGKPCQRWSAKEPKNHKRPPEVFRELENFCCLLLNPFPNNKILG